jgi:hypothetical protein
MPLECLKILACLNIPEFDGLINAARGEAFSIGGEGN